jgi:hypothetical protein
MGTLLGSSNGQIDLVRYRVLRMYRSDQYFQDKLEKSIYRSWSTGMFSVQNITR